MESSHVSLPSIFVIPSGAGQPGKRIQGNDWARFWSYVNLRDPTECWPWGGTTDEGGYGRFSVKRPDGTFTSTPAHRWLLGQLRGRPLLDKPRGLEDGCHTCNNPSCCNPLHLYVDTRSGNLKYAVATGRHAQTAKEKCPAGHLYTEGNTYLTPSGERRCRTCRSKQSHQTDIQRKAARTHCKKKHLLAGDNLIICKGGRRKCRECEADRIEKAVVGRQRQAAARR